MMKCHRLPNTPRSRLSHQSDHLHLDFSDFHQASTILDFAHLRYKLTNPIELRNMIYKYAMDDTYHRFPSNRYANGTKPKPKRRRRAVDPSHLVPRWLPYSLTNPIPFMGFTQTCSQIRWEFYSSWLSQARIPLSSVDTFLPTFFPHSSRRTTGGQLWKGVKRIRILLRPFEISQRNITNLVKLRNRLPNVVFEPVQVDYTQADFKSDMSRFLNNQHPRWLQWLRNHTISSIHLNLHDVIRIRIVIKDKQAPAWMRAPVFSVPPSRKDVEYLASLGLEWSSPKQIRFGVDYS